MSSRQLRAAAACRSHLARRLPAALLLFAAASPCRDLPPPLPLSRPRHLVEPLLPPPPLPQPTSRKVNFPPYLFEADLHAEVDHANSKATVGNGTVVFTLPKTVPGLWPELVAKEL